MFNYFIRKKQEGDYSKKFIWVVSGQIEGRERPPILSVAAQHAAPLLE
jgi:hypothetical protein